jgi:hypothetical protein
VLCVWCAVLTVSVAAVATVKCFATASHNAVFRRTVLIRVYNAQQSDDGAAVDKQQRRASEGWPAHRLQLVLGAVANAVELLED